MGTPIRVLVVEDSEDDAVLLVSGLRDAGYDPAFERVDTAEAMRAALATQPWDIVIADYSMPRFSASAALTVLQECGLDLPFIIVSGVIGEDAAVAAMKAGAHDYIMKGTLARLIPAVERELREAAVRQERKWAEEQLKSSHEQLRALSGHLQSVREEEGTRIALEIHDELGQALTGLRMDLTWLGSRLRQDQKSLLKRIQAMSKLIDATIQAVRRISTELRPRVLDDIGLMAALEWQAQDFQTRTGIRCKFSSRVEELSLDQDRSTAVFRIFQETLTNVVRHAHATSVNISLRDNAGNLILEVRDNGKGIADGEISDARSLGLLGMRERAALFGGEVDISGIAGRGTRVTVRIPLRKSEEVRVTQ